MSSPPASTHPMRSRPSGAVWFTALLLAMGMAPPASAANWLQLYNTTPPGIKGHVDIWGFVQPVYSASWGGAVHGLAGPASVQALNGTTPNFNAIGPELDSSHTAMIKRARLGVRGRFGSGRRPWDYFVLAEFGDNGLTYFAGRHPVLSDAFITWNRSSFVRLSAGLQKVPGSWEERVGIAVLPYINFTTAAQQNLLERYVRSDAPVTAAGNGGYQFVPDSHSIGGFSAFRDVGLKAFDWFRHGRWEYAYAFMLGRGGPLDLSHAAPSPDRYGMLRASYIFGGKGADRNDAGAWVWFHQGQRRLDGLGDFNMSRWGIGGVYSRRQRQRGGYAVRAGYMQAQGWILASAPFAYDAATQAQYSASARAGYDKLTQWTLYPGHDNRAHGSYAQLAYYPTRKLELQLRYDTYARLTNQAALQRNFRTWTLGAQYFMTRGLRWSLDYAIRDLQVAHPGAIANPVQRANAQAIARTMGNRIDLQLTAVF